MIRRRLRIGITGPFTGPRAAYGNLLKAAVARLDPWFEPIFGDDMAQIPQAEAVARLFVAEGVQAVVGHFNSDCARAAGAIYGVASLPFLMPASTADDLLGSTDGYRICASDSMQIDALEGWLSRRGVRVAEIWEDGSPYAARLGAAIRARDMFAAGGVSNVLVALLGAHHTVAREMQRRGRFSEVVFVPDDCAIEEFSQLLADVDAQVLCPFPEPQFSDCVSIALNVLKDIALADNLPEALERHRAFAGRQYIKAGFALQQRRYRQSNFEKVKS